MTIEEYLKLQQEMDPLINMIQNILKYLNLPHSCSLILSILILLQIEVSFKDVVTLTKYTKSTISSCLNILDKMSLVSKVKRGRRHIYMSKVDLPEILLLKQKSILDEEVEPFSNKIGRMVSELEMSGRISERLSDLNMKLKTLSTRLRQLIKNYEESVRISSDPTQLQTGAD